MGALPTLAFASCATLQSAPPEPTKADIAWIAKGEFCDTETVLPLPDGTLLVSNVCDFRSSGDGFLSLLDAKGNILDWRIVDGLDSPLGMAFHDGKIHVIDANRVRSYAWPGYAPLGVTELDTKVANDIAAAPDGTLYISDSAGGVVALAPDGTQSRLESNIDFAGANGMEMGPDGMLYVGGERLWRVDLSTGKAQTIGPEWLKDIDGIEFEADGTLQVTPVGGALIRLPRGGKIEILGGEGVSSANHGYDAKSGLALIPTGFDNTVIAIRVADD